MKILIVSSKNSGKISPFVKAQAESLAKLGVQIEYCLIEGKGHFGYLSNYSKLNQQIRDFSPDLIHAHYGLSGLLACCQFKVPVVITYHGSDINRHENRKYSYVASKLASENIFVHPDLPGKIGYKKEINLIPCGVDFEVFYPLDIHQVRDELGLDQEKLYILFSSSFDREVKNYPLAKKALELLEQDINLIELKGFEKNQVNKLMNAVDLLLVTSFSETGPLVVKEAMACNKPIVSTDVGDVRYLCKNLDGHYICDNNPKDVSDKIIQAIDFSKNNDSTKGRQRIIDLGYDIDEIAKRLLNLYKNILSKNE